MWFGQQQESHQSSVFYVDSDYESLSLSNAKMESEVRSLRQEVCRTRDSLRLANRRCGELTRELDSLGAAHERERQLRDRQLSRILRALLVLESRLKLEQKSIRRLLNDKDALIAQQRHRIDELASSADTVCPRCSRDLQATSHAGVSSEVEGAGGNEPVSLESSDFQEHDSGLGRDIEKLKCEILTKLNESQLEATSHPLDAHDDPQHQQPDDQTQPGVKKTHSFAGSDISKASLASSENTDASIITTTTDGSPSLLSTEGFCEGESTDVSPGSTLNKSNSSRCTPSIVATDSETEGNGMLIVTDEHDVHHKCTRIARSDSKDDGMDCNYASDEEEEDDEADDADIDEPVYENNLRNLGEQSDSGVKANSDDCANNNVQRITRLQESRPLRRDDDRNQQQQHHHHHQNQQEQSNGAEESSGNWYSDPDEDRLNDELLRHSVYRPISNHNSVLECVNQILLRDMEDEENVLSVPRRFKHRGKIVRFQPARLSDIESVGSEMERRNSDEPAPASPANTAASSSSPSSCDGSIVGASGPDVALDGKHQQRDENDNDDGAPINGFEATNSEDEFGMRIVPTIVPVLDPESGLGEDVDETKARPLVIIEPRVKIEEPRNKSNSTRSSTSKSSNGLSGNSVGIGKLCLAPGSPTSPRMERIEEKTCLSMSGKGLTLAKNLDYEDIELLPPLPSSTSSAKLCASSAPALPPKPQFRSNTLVLKKIPSPSFLIDEQSRKRQPPPEQPPLNCLRSLNFDQQPRKSPDAPLTKKPPRSSSVKTSSPTSSPSNVVTSIVRHFEEFRIDEEAKRGQRQQQQQVLEDLDIQQNFEEFKLDECELDGDQILGDQEVQEVQQAKEAQEAESQQQNGTYDSFLEATGLSNKSILTPSRLLSNHKSMLKPKDVKYKSRIKASAVMQLERHATTTIHTKHWTGPFV